MAYPKLTRRLVIWLEEFRTRHKWICWAASVGVGLLAALAWFLTYWLVYFILWIGFSWLLGSETSRAVGAMIVLALLVEAHRRANWAYLEELETDHPTLVNTLRVAGWVTGDHFLVLAGPKTLSSFVKVLSMIGLTAPRLSQLAYELVIRGQTASTLDPQPCATVIAKLIKSDRKVPLEDLTRKYPDFDWKRTLREVTLVEGIRLRIAETPLLSISDERRSSLAVELDRIPVKSTSPKTEESESTSEADPVANEPMPLAESSEHEVVSPLSSDVAPDTHRPPSETIPFDDAEHP
jgi:hypothetical protein